MTNAQVDRLHRASATEGGVAHFSAIAGRLDARDQGRPELEERLTLWRELIDEYNPPRGRVVDLGCGSGVLSFLAAERAGRVVGIDGAPEMIKLCERRRRERGLGQVRFIQAPLPYLDGLEAKADLGDADLVICASLLESVDDLDTGLSLLARLARQGGTVLVSMPNLLGISRIYRRITHSLRDAPTPYRHIRHFTSPPLLRRRLRRHGLMLMDAHYFDHHTRPASLTRRLGLPAPLTKELFVAVCTRC
jgi:2-polyprenyl-3-methyl-5-hydroxy-6-metoxy-1,4-benzoquinol methylase